MALQNDQHDPKIFKIALEKLLKRKNYHVASPTEKNKMLMEEYKRILNKGDVRNKCSI
jgi:hypothetical protein